MTTKKSTTDSEPQTLSDSSCNLGGLITKDDINLLIGKVPYCTWAKDSTRRIRVKEPINLVTTERKYSTLEGCSI